ncbi:metallopeptidase [Aureliella helgolandensis]|uniref:Metallopeptidase n=1 Tax=Aureliella helgolandensis TaxID=2527968 RepID=A0A518G1N7_9BACT|nr:metallopeptidase [Aureliella helgolandensis]QDV22497.1 hypothetical protein Q31a_07830 [Aureliella helgolandensis]
MNTIIEQGRVGSTRKKLLLACLLLLLLPTDLRGDDSSPAFYQPTVRQIEGWTVKVDPMMLTDEHAEKGQRALDALANHLQRCTYVIKGETLAELQKLPIWIEWAGQGRGLVYHPNRDWLKDNGFNPAMARHVHVPNVDHLLERKQWGKHPYAIMHELAHAYHDQVLGWQAPEIRTLFEAAKNSGGYDNVLTHDHQTARHYGMNNHKEYFAESTEAYLGVNDFYPFVRAELKQHDPRMFALLAQIWGDF